MNEQTNVSLDERVARLEHEVASLQQYNERLNRALESAGIQFSPVTGEAAQSGAVSSAQPSNYPPPYHFQPGFYGYAPPPVALPYPANYNWPNSSTQPESGQGYGQVAPAYNKASSTRTGFDFLRSGEFWLNKIGIGLLLFGVAFLFTYAVDQGWLVPAVRVILGFIIGAALLGFGLRTSRKRPHFGQVLLGGSVAAFYISIFAAFQLYNLVSYPTAFAGMGLVTLLAFGLSIRQDGEALSLIGVAGGLATPFVLHQGEGSLPGLVGYTCVMLAGAGAIYFYRGWHWLLATAFVGGWTALAIGIVQANGYYSRATTFDKAALQAGLIFSWLLFAALPVVRELVATRRWGKPANQPNYFLNLAIVLALATGLLFSATLWHISKIDGGWITLVIAAIYGLVAWAITPASARIAYTHAAVAVLTLTLALILLLEGDALLLALALEATVVQFAAYRLKQEQAAFGGLLLFFGLGYWLVVRLVLPNYETTPALNVRSLVDLTFIVLVAVAAEFVKTRRWENLYYFFAHAAFMGWLWRELSLLPDGNAYITVAWGVYGAILLLLGLGWDKKQLMRFGLATLLAVVVKLFLVDLASLATLWRVILFLGFGVIFLVLSYFFQDLWKRPADQNQS